jgi:hypothetical protein
MSRPFGSRRPESVMNSAELSAYITERVAAFAQEAHERLRWLVPCVRQFAALPLYVGWVEVIAVRPDGALVRWSTEGDYQGTRAVSDATVARAALVEGTKRYPPLRDLIPTRPAAARTCPDCGGAGALAALPNVSCACGGVGWLDGTG